ncbi:unnamed protein product [Cyprideis torosa]|uniref:Uncharacterized protein n=1 Tax=Cyprideis torosa TaxID=163714 RepID=A0A7R8W114_9CRUS|nr:unnamed protein product [Cyprideis torosa]CAG0880392.1 unnamed protein product [Cyprideis torosa]
MSHPSALPLVKALGSAFPLVTALGSAFPLVTALGSAFPLVTALGSAFPLVTALGSAFPLVTALGSADQNDSGWHLFASLLENFAFDCSVDSRTQRCVGDPDLCLASLRSLLGTEIARPCSCDERNEQDKALCQQWRRTLWDNACVGKERTLWDNACVAQAIKKRRKLLARPRPPPEPPKPRKPHSTTARAEENGKLMNSDDASQIQSRLFASSSGTVASMMRKKEATTSTRLQAPSAPYSADATNMFKETQITRTDDNTMAAVPRWPQQHMGPSIHQQDAALGPAAATAVLAKGRCAVSKDYHSSSSQFLDFGESKIFYSEGPWSSCPVRCSCRQPNQHAYCQVVYCHDRTYCSSPSTGAKYAHGDTPYHACVCFSGSFLCAKHPEGKSLMTPSTGSMGGIFLYLGISSREEEALQISLDTMNDALRSGLNQFGSKEKSENLVETGTQTEPKPSESEITATLMIHHF